jgi:hypothetical protein
LLYSVNRATQAIRDEKLAIHLVDGKVQLKVDEVINLFFPKGLFD